MNSQSPANQRSSPPAPPREPLANHGARLSRLRERIAGESLDAILISDEVNVRYLSGFGGDSSTLIVGHDGTTILSDGRYETQLKAECPGLPASIRPPHVLMPAWIGSFLASGEFAGGNRRRIGFESEHVSVAMAERIGDAAKEMDWVGVSGLVETLRERKDPAEVASIRRAVDVAESAFRTVTAKLDPAMTERQIARALESTMRDLGASGCSFDPIVAADAAAANPHYRPADRPIGDWDVLLIDWGAMVDGYASDLTRTLHRGDQPNGDFETAYRAVLAAQTAAIDAIGPGVLARDVDAAARSVLARDDLADAFKHGLGHGIGLQIHESPRISAAAGEVRLRPGMIVTVEPGVYLEGRFGIRIEDDVLVTSAGAELLSDLPRGLEDCRSMR